MESAWDLLKQYGYMCSVCVCVCVCLCITCVCVCVCVCVFVFLCFVCVCVYLSMPDNIACKIHNTQLDIKTK